MPERLHKIGLVASDVEAAVAFYTRQMDLKVVERFAVEGDQDYVFLQGGDVLLELMPAASARALPGFHHLSFEVEDIDAAAALMESRGARLIKGPFDVGVAGIRLCIFAGPDGVEVQLFERRLAPS